MSRVLIVGGGAIGSSIAYHLLSHPGFDGEVVVVERDPAYARASSALSAGSIRQQYSSPINIALSAYGAAFLRDAGALLAVDGEAPDIGFHDGSYLYLAATAGGAQALRDNHAVQRAAGASVALLDPAALKARFPWLRVDDLALGAVGLKDEGWFDGYALLQALRRKARALGARYVHGEVVGMHMQGDRIATVQLADGTTLGLDRLVDAAGPWAARVAAMAGVDLPVRARRRTVFAFSCPAPLAGCPLLIDPSGVWFRPEGRQFICGLPPVDDPDDLPLDPDHALWETHAWPALAHRVPAFEAVRQTSAWAGYYEYNTFDQNAIVGPHPTVANLLLANGFSGHGLQQAPAVGRGLAEWVVDGAYRSIDLAPLSVARVLANRPLVERNVI